MKDEHGNFLTGKKGILEHTVQYFKNILENRPIKADLTEHQKDREEKNEISKSKHNRRLVYGRS